MKKKKPKLKDLEQLNQHDLVGFFLFFFFSDS